MAESTVIMPDSSGLGGLGGGLGAVLIGALLGNNGIFGGNRGYGYGGPAAGAVASEVVLTPTLNAIQNQISTLENSVNAHNVDNGLTSINQNISGTSRDQLQAINNVATAQAAANFTTLNSINGLGRDVVAAQNQAALQQLNSFNVLTTTTLQGFNAQAMQTQNATNQIIAQGTALAAQLANCCCEMKQVVKEDGNATRALINDLNVQSLQAQLTDAKVQISNNAQNQYLLTQILTHIHPTPVVS